MACQLRRKKTMATKREKKQQQQQTAKPAKVAKTSPPALASLTNDDEPFTDLLLLVEADDHAVDDSASTTSTEVYIDDSERTSYTLGERQDRVLVATSDEVIIMSTLEPLKTMTFNVNRWARFVALMTNVDEEAKELNRKTRPVAYRQHLGDGYYVTVTGGVMCVDFRKYYVPYGLPSDQIRPTKSGIALRLEEWADMLQVVPTIHATFPELATAKRFVNEDSHLGQCGWMQCTSCFPFGHEFAVV